MIMFMTYPIVEHLAAACRDVAQVMLAVLVLTPMVSGELDMWMLLVGLVGSFILWSLGTYLLKKFDQWKPPSLSR